VRGRHHAATCVPVGVSQTKREWCRRHRRRQCNAAASSRVVCRRREWDRTLQVSRA
jgi:hypothetical protein